MLVLGNYHYPCQVVISFVLSWLGDVKQARRHRAESFPRSRSMARNPVFLGSWEGMDPRLRGDDRGVVGGDFFVAVGNLCVPWYLGLANCCGLRGWTDKICQLGPIFGPALSIMVRCEEKRLQACGPGHCTL